MATQEITHVFNKITVDKVEDHKYKKDLMQAQLRQVVSVTYPSTRVGNSLSDNLFDVEDFNLTAGKTYESNRIAWVNVPKGSTMESVVAQLAKLPNARLQRILASEPILSEEQKQGIKAGLTTVEVIGESQMVRDEENNPILHAGLPQYKVNVFCTTGENDIDYRSASTDVATVKTNVAVEEFASTTN